MRKSVLVFITVLLTVSGFAQKTADIGIWGGASTYWGDMTQVNYNQSIKPMFGAFFRYNFNARTGLRMQYMLGQIGAQGFMNTEVWNFSSPVQDFSVLVEINYLKYILGLKKTPVSPYIMAGVGFTYYQYSFDADLANKLLKVNPESLEVSNHSFFQNGLLIIIPFDQKLFTPKLSLGMGIKTHIGSRFGIGVEFLLNKLFNDKIDDLNDPLAHRNQTGNAITFADFFHNNDYTAYFGINLTYKIYMGKQICPAYESKN